MSELEITALVLSEHEAFRRAFADLDQADDLAAAWLALAQRLEIHAAAEEEMFYPLLADAAQDGVEQGVAAVREHNDIRHAVAEVENHQLGDERWWEAVRTTQEVNAEHMAEEEREFIVNFKESVDDGRREKLGLRWLQFHDDHDEASGLTGDGADPDAVVARDAPATGTD